ncbi:MAG TPA: Uma2 family endonuclease [Thermoanaerobaculia bacterium]
MIPPMAASPPRVDPFRFGWRYRYVPQPNGEVIQEQIPLTPADLLDPQLGDEIPQTTQHYRKVHDLQDQLRTQFRGRKDALVVSDLKMLWRIPGLAEPAPDVAVIFGIQDRETDRDSFDCILEGTRPSLIIEVVDSRDPELRRHDYERKVTIYEKVEIPEYIILDPPTPSTKGRCLLTGYRLGANQKYRPIQPDAQGFLLSETTQLRFGVAEDGRSFQVIEAVAGKPLLTLPQMDEARKQAEERAAQEKERAEREVEARKAAEAEIARLRAELERARRG